MGRIRLTSVAALIVAGTLGLAACSSGGGDTDTTNPPAGGNSSSLSPVGNEGDISCATGSLDAAGSTAQANAMDAWRKAYQQACSGVTVNYNPTGSGDGVTAFTNGTIDFAGSDSALDAEAGEVAAAQKRCDSTPLDLPMVVGPIAIAYQLDGVDSLVLDGPTTAKIFLGTITKWDDPAIAALNKDADLPDTAVTPFYRSDSSGTTKNFEQYLAATAPDVFSTEPDKDSAAAGFAGQGKEGSQGVADAIGQTQGGVGYVEFSYAVNGGLATASIDNGGGPVELSKDTASAAAGTAKVTGTGDDLTLQIDYAQETPGAYPLILVTYEIVCTQYSDATKAKLIRSFLDYTAGGGQDLLAQAGYAPLPPELLAEVKASVAKIS